METMQLGDNVIIDLNGDKQTFVKLRESGTVMVAGHSCPTQPLEGAPWGAAFLVNQAGELERASFNPHDKLQAATETDKSNSELVDGDGNQRLSAEDVSALKAEKHGEELLEAIQSGSSTFADKTEFSQEKWRKRKAKKYILHVTARRPTSQLISHSYFSTAPSKVCDLRPDTLAIMMSLANVGPHARVLCMDACFGTVTTACVERMAGQGTLCCGHLDGKRGRLEAPRLLNKRHWLAQSARQVSVAALLQVEPEGEADASQGGDAMQADDAAPAENGAASATERSAASRATETDASPASGSGDAAPSAGNASDVIKPRLHEPVPAGARVPDAIACATDQETVLMARQGFDSVVLAAPRYDPAPIMLRLRPLMQPSASVVVYSQSMQPLVECFHALQQSREFVGLQLQESWMREIQVLPARTHPMMAMSGSGGYMLSGIRVTNDEAPAGLETPAAPKKKRQRSNGRA